MSDIAQIPDPPIASEDPQLGGGASVPPPAQTPSPAASDANPTAQADASATQSASAPSAQATGAPAAAIGQPTVAAPSTGILDRLRLHGIQAKSEDQLIADVVSLRSVYPQLKESAERYRQFQPYMQEFMQWQAERQAAAQKQPAQEKPQEPDFYTKYRAPEFDENLLSRYFEKDEHGDWQPLPTTPPHIIAAVQPKIGPWQQYRTDHWKNLTNRPAEYFHKDMGFVHKNDLESLEQKIYERVTQEFKGREYHQELSGTLDSLVKQHPEYAPTPGQDGMRVPSPQGQRLKDNISMLMQSGVAEREAISLGHHLTQLEIKAAGEAVAAQQQSARVAASLPAVASAPNRVGADQTNPSQPLAQTIEQAFASDWASVHKSLFGGA